MQQCGAIFGLVPIQDARAVADFHRKLTKAQCEVQPVGRRRAQEVDPSLLWKQRGKSRSLRRVRENTTHHLERSWSSTSNVKKTYNCRHGPLIRTCVRLSRTLIDQPGLWSGRKERAGEKRTVCESHPAVYVRLYSSTKRRSIIVQWRPFYCCLFQI